MQRQFIYGFLQYLLTFNSVLSTCQNLLFRRWAVTGRCTGLSMSRLGMRCQSRKWDSLHALNIQLLELSLVLGCIFVIKLAHVTNQACELSWAHACMLVCDCACLIKGLDIHVSNRSPAKLLFCFLLGKGQPN